LLTAGLTAFGNPRRPPSKTGVAGKHDWLTKHVFDGMRRSDKNLLKCYALVWRREPHVL